MFLAKTYSSAPYHMIETMTHLAELDTHLIIRVDTPDSTLNVDLVFVHGDQCTKGSRVEFLEHDAVGGLVAFKDLGLDESSVGCCVAEFFTDLLLGLSECKCPGDQLCPILEMTRCTRAEQRSWKEGSRGACRQR